MREVLGISRRTFAEPHQSAAFRSLFVNSPWIWPADRRTSSVRARHAGRHHQQFADGTLRPAPVQPLPIADAVTGFHTIAQARRRQDRLDAQGQIPNTLVARASTEPSGSIRRHLLITGGLEIGTAPGRLARRAGPAPSLDRPPSASGTAERTCRARTDGVNTLVAQADVAGASNWQPHSHSRDCTLRGVIHHGRCVGGQHVAAARCSPARTGDATEIDVRGPSTS